MEPTQPFEMPVYRKKMSIFWWTKRTSHLKFILRELTSVPVAYTTILLVFLLRSLSKGSQTYWEFMEMFKSPFVVVLNIIAFGGLLFHSITWFNLAPKAMVIRMGKKKVPASLIAAGNYAGWIILSSVIICWIILHN